jgi:hypothetical protein
MIDSVRGRPGLRNAAGIEPAERDVEPSSPERLVMLPTIIEVIVQGGVERVSQTNHVISDAEGLFHVILGWPRIARVQIEKDVARSLFGKNIIVKVLVVPPK